ncbi:MAG: DUF3080 family protein [Pseudoalteromonas sp.]
MTGCTEQPRDIHLEYQKRLSHTVDKPLVKAEKLSNIPQTVFSLLNEDKISVGVLQLAQLNKCALSTLIAEHNSQLGKLATPASRLIYQIEFIKAAPACLKLLDETSNTYQQISAALLDKKTLLAHHFKHFLYNDVELKKTWQLTHYELDTNFNGLVETELALERIATIKQQIDVGNYENINTQHIYKSLEQLNRFNFNQALITASRNQTYLNELATDFLESNIELNALCDPLKNKKQAKIISNIFKKFYLEQLQPYQSQLTGALERLMPYYQTLWGGSIDNQNALSNLLLDTSTNNLLNRLKKSAKHHVVWWQGFYKQCEISPI